MSNIDSLKAQQSEQVTDAFVTNYDYINDDGDKVKDQSFTHPEYGEVTDKVNMTNLYEAGLSTTNDITILVMEAKLLDEGRLGERSNPHIPATRDTLEQAKDRIEARDLTPAWTIFEPGSGNPATSEAGADTSTP